ARVGGAGAAPGLQGLGRVPARVPRFLLRGLSLRGSRLMRRWMEGSEAIAEAAIAAGCRFFAGYPMTPFTELLESFAAKLPAVQRAACGNAESELEPTGMAGGARATGA